MRKMQSLAIILTDQPAALAGWPRLLGAAQAGRFDCPDRLFSSVPHTWITCTQSTSCFKESLPEFYYLPDFLINVNKSVS